MRTGNSPDLTGAYNDAMAKIDTQLKTLSDAIESVPSGFDPDDTDQTLTVQQLSEAKVTKSGIVYFKATE